MKISVALIIFALLLPFKTSATSPEDALLALSIRAKVCQNGSPQSDRDNCKVTTILPEEQTLISMNHCEQSEILEKCSGRWKNTFEQGGQQIETLIRISHYLFPRKFYEISVVQQDPERIRQTRKLTEFQLGDQLRLDNPLIVTGKPVALDSDGAVVIPQLLISQ
jgi:hypothetical protein